MHSSFGIYRQVVKFLRIIFSEWLSKLLDKAIESTICENDGRNVKMIIELWTTLR